MSEGLRKAMKVWKDAVEEERQASVALEKAQKRCQYWRSELVKAIQALDRAEQVEREAVADE